MVFVSLAYFDILYLISILLWEYKMSKRNLFEELKSGLKNAKYFEQKKLTFTTTASTEIEPRLLFVKKIHEIKEKI